MSLIEQVALWLARMERDVERAKVLFPRRPDAGNVKQSAAPQTGLLTQEKDDGWFSQSKGRTGRTEDRDLRPSGIGQDVHVSADR
jgi:hypothetical protein